MREEWLRDGVEQMNIDNETFDLDELADRFHATDLEKRLVRAYFELNEATRTEVMKMLTDVFQNGATPPWSVDEVSDDAQKLHAELDRQLAKEKNPEGDVQVS